MTLNRNKLYSILSITCLVGYIWIYLNISKGITKNNSFEVCLIKHVTNIPCPSCGSTRSVISLAKGNFYEALSINPLGLVVAIIMLLTPLWIIIDIITKSDYLFNFYNKTEFYLKNPKFAIPLVLLVISNWVWNITKGL